MLPQLFFFLLTLNSASSHQPYHQLDLTVSDPHASHEHHFKRANQNQNNQEEDGIDNPLSARESQQYFPYTVKVNHLATFHYTCKAEGCLKECASCAGGGVRSLSCSIDQSQTPPYPPKQKYNPGTLSENCTLNGPVSVEARSIEIVDDDGDKEGGGEGKKGGGLGFGSSLDVFKEKELRFFHFHVWNVVIGALAGGTYWYRNLRRGLGKREYQRV